MVAALSAIGPVGTEAVMDLKTFAARLKELRGRAGLSQKELAERAGLSQRAISSWEQAWREPGWLAVVALAEALDVEVTAFLEEPKEVLKPRPGRPRKDQGEPPADQGGGKKRKGKGGGK
jgi:transcriptional regulator with XRE-family HTH domain